MIADDYIFVDEDSNEPKMDKKAIVNSLQAKVYQCPIDKFQRFVFENQIIENILWARDKQKRHFHTQRDLKIIKTDAKIERNFTTLLRTKERRLQESQKYILHNDRLEFKVPQKIEDEPNKSQDAEGCTETEPIQKQKQK